MEQKSDELAAVSHRRELPDQSHAPQDDSRQDAPVNVVIVRQSACSSSSTIPKAPEPGYFLPQGKSALETHGGCQSSVVGRRFQLQPRSRIKHIPPSRSRKRAAGTICDDNNPYVDTTSPEEVAMASFTLQGLSLGHSGGDKEPQVPGSLPFRPSIRGSTLSNGMSPCPPPNVSQSFWSTARLERPNALRPAANATNLVGTEGQPKSREDFKPASCGRSNLNEVLTPKTARNTPEELYPLPTRLSITASRDSTSVSGGITPIPRMSLSPRRGSESQSIFFPSLRPPPATRVTATSSAPCNSPRLGRSKKSSDSAVHNRSTDELEHDSIPKPVWPKDEKKLPVSCETLSVRESVTNSHPSESGILWCESLLFASNRKDDPLLNRDAGHNIDDDLSDLDDDDCFFLVSPAELAREKQHQSMEGQKRCKQRRRSTSMSE